CFWRKRRCTFSEAKRRAAPDTHRLVSARGRLSSARACAGGQVVRRHRQRGEPHTIDRSAAARSHVPETEHLLARPIGRSAGRFAPRLAVTQAIFPEHSPAFGNGGSHLLAAAHLYGARCAAPRTCL